MSSVNLHTKEIALKIVYYGPGLGGKTASLKFIHQTLKPDTRGQLVSLATGADRTLYFDFLPVRLPKLRGYSIRVQLYTVPGQVHYNSTRKLVLSGADGIVFVADSQVARREANVESLDNLKENLREQGHAFGSVPLVYQYNKRDLDELLSSEDLDRELNELEAPIFETSATTGRGVFEALKAITTLALSDLRRRGVWKTGPDAEDLRESHVQQPEALTPITDGSIAASLQALAEQTTEREPAGLDLKPLEPEKAQPQVHLGDGAALSEILPPGPTRDAVVTVEYLVHRGDFVAAVLQADKVFSEASTADPLLAATPSGDLSALHALNLGISGMRYLRFRNSIERARTGSASSADALFALFFLTDAALRR